MKIIEVVGLAGVGKSTLTDALIDELPGSRGQYRLRKMHQSMRILSSLRYSLPLMLRASVKKNIGNPYRSLLQFEASMHDLKEIKHSEEGVLVLDQGPLFNYVSLLIYELDINGLAWVKKQYLEMITDFGCALDGVIHLNAPVGQLISRVKQRSVEHQLKGKEIDAQYAFYEDYDRKYTNLLNDFEKKCGLPILELDTSSLSIEEVKESSTEFISSL